MPLFKVIGKKYILFSLLIVMIKSFDSCAFFCYYIFNQVFSENVESLKTWFRCIAALLVFNLNL